MNATCSHKHMHQETKPRAVLLENVRGILDPKSDYRKKIVDELSIVGLTGEWKLLNASDFGVSQLGLALSAVVTYRKWPFFEWPAPLSKNHPPSGSCSSI